MLQLPFCDALISIDHELFSKVSTYDSHFIVFSSLLKIYVYGCCACTYVHNVHAWSSGGQKTVQNSLELDLQMAVNAMCVL